MKTRNLTNIKKTIRRQTRRNANGMSLIELGAVAVFMPLIAVLCVNVGILVFIAGINDSACKDAARAAGQRSTAEDAFNAASAIVARYAASSGSLAHLSLLGNSKNIPFEVYPDADGNPQIAKGPNVTISTQSVVNLPAPIVFDGAKFTNKMTFRRSYTFPILNPARPNNDVEITVSNAPDAAANAADAELLALAKKSEAASEAAALAEEKAATAAQASAAAKTASDAAATAAMGAAPGSPLERAASKALNEYNSADEKAKVDAEAADKAQIAADNALAELDTIEAKIENAYGENSAIERPSTPMPVTASENDASMG